MIVPTLTPAQEYEIISAIITAVGRTITLTYSATRAVCSVCGGNDPFCSTCHGNPTTDTTATRTVLANVKWKGSNKKLYFPEGQDPDGDCIVHILVDTPEAYDALDAILKKILTVTVDGRVCVLKYWTLRGSPVNRVNLVLVQQDDVGGQRIG